MSKLASIIIPTLHLQRNHRLRDVVRRRGSLNRLLESLQQVGDENIEVIVICNGQDEQLVEFVVSSDGITRYALMSQNIGVSRAWNVGVEMSEGDYLCFLNDDVVVGDGAISFMRDALVADVSIGQIGPAGAMWIDGKHSNHVQEGRSVVVDAVAGYAFMVPRHVFASGTRFDTSFSPAWFEEVDFSFRLREQGLQCVVDERIDVKHLGHGGVSTTGYAITYMGRDTNLSEVRARNEKVFTSRWR